jgi:E3 ubiquitin-protein ligase ZSWIM2
MKLDPEEVCCVCHEEMKESENLTFCKVGCGRNIHTDCIEVWVKHKVSSAQKITCPLCRTDWGSNALEDLKEETKQFKEKKIEENRAKVKESLKNDRAFKCYCCKRTLTYEARLQCIFCEVRIS